MRSELRYKPCKLLHDQDIPCLVWFEDAIAHYGAPTVVFDLYLLVPNIDEAAQALVTHGWANATADQAPKYHFLARHPSISRRRLNPPSIKEGKGTLSKERPPAVEWFATVLLPAADWNVSVDQLRPSSPGGFIPPLSVLVDALIESLLDSPTDSFLRVHLALHICYLYGNCQTLKAQEFARRLNPENRQFHYDALSKPGLGTLPFIAHERRVRDEIRIGGDLREE